MNLSKTNRKLIKQLRQSLDSTNMQSALDRGEITPIQARNLAKWFAAVKDIRDNPFYAVQDRSGRFVGEVLAKGGGAVWVGKRYGEPRPHDMAEFADVDAAVRFVQRI